MSYLDVLENGDKDYSADTLFDISRTPGRVNPPLSNRKALDVRAGTHESNRTNEESPIAGEANCAICSNDLETTKVPSRTVFKAVIICSGCKKPICSLCVSDFHYKLGPLCYPCLRLEQQKQQILSNKPF